MKKLLYILITLSLFTACSSDEDNKDINEQDYTSFVFEFNVDVTATNCIAAYKKDNKYYKLGELGDLSKGKISPEIRVNDNSITEVYFFTDYNAVTRTDHIFYLKKKYKNIFKLTDEMKGIHVYDKTDPTQYPQ